VQGKGEETFGTGHAHHSPSRLRLSGVTDGGRKKESFHQMLHALNTGSLCAIGCRFHNFRALPDGKRSVTLYTYTRPQISDLEN
jgi:hypothetical protein